MIEFEDFVYMDVEKTGSTTVRVFFKQFAGSKLVADGKHRPIKIKQPDKTYIISCRNPYSQYKSLYKYGAMGRGSIRDHFELANRGALYDPRGEGFLEWLAILLDYGQSKKILRKKDFHPCMQCVGLQTLRFLRLDIPNFNSKFRDVRCKNDVEQLYKSEHLHDIILRTETLTQDLMDMTDISERNLIADPAAAKEYLKSAKPRTVSGKTDVDEITLPPELHDLILRREWLFFEILGYGAYTCA